MIPFEILKGLPSDGPPAIPFPADSPARYSEGLVIRFGACDEAWVGNFLGGGSSFDWVGPMPDGEHLLVISRGAGYAIDPYSRALVERLGGGISDVIADEAGHLILFDCGQIDAIGPAGRIWSTYRTACDGFRNLRIAGNRLLGEAYQAWDDSWLSFDVNVETGSAKLD